MTLTTGGFRFYADYSHGGDPTTWIAQRLVCWQSANPSAVVRTSTDQQMIFEVPNPMPSGLIMKDGGTDYSTAANTSWQYVPLSATQVSTIDPTTCGKSSAPPVLKPWEFPVSAYGAVGDGDHDDTAALNACHADAWAYAASHNGVYSVVLDALTYHIASAPSTAHSGNAQLPWPYTSTDSAPGADTGMKMIGTWTCPYVGDQSPLYHWLQKVPQQAGAVLKSTWDAGGSIPAAGEASVIGGPTTQGLGSNPPAHWSNVLPIIDNVQVSVPNHPNVSGIDLRCFAQAYVKSAVVLAAQDPGVNGAPLIPPPGWAFGLAMPLPSNNARCDIGFFGAQGLTYGLVVYEHLQAESLRLVNNYTNFIVWSNQSTPHQNHVDYMCNENGHNLIQMAGSTGKLIIEMADVEWGPGPIFTDSCVSPASGRITIGSNGTDGVSLNGALNPPAATAVTGTTHVKIINSDQKTGAVAAADAPTVPASGTALHNPFWRDAEVMVSGAGVTGISVDGQAKPVTSGPVSVPSGSAITLTYTGATPSCAWTLT